MNEVIAKDVQDAMINCFYEAHCADAALGEEEQPNRQYCISIIKKVFTEQGVDFENPTKAGLFKVINGLAEFSKNFRSQDVIEKHKKIITDLINKMV